MLSPRLTAITADLILFAGAAVESVLGVYLLVTVGLAGVGAAWPAPLTAIAHLLLWPFALPAGRAAAQLGGLAIVIAMVCYLGLTCAALGGLNLLTRQPRAAASPRWQPASAAPEEES